VDTAVGLVQAYLHVNGYFTIAEYPVLEDSHAGEIRTVTDLDILAYRFAGAGHELLSGRGHQPAGGPFFVDPLLGCPPDRPDMIVGEVKEGRARLNAALRDAAVLEAALSRFGCCPADHSPDLARQLLSRGRALTPAGHEIRMVAFGDSPAGARERSFTIVPMGHVVQYLQKYIHANWAVLRHAQLRDPAFALLALLEKWGVPETSHLPADTGGQARPT